MAPPLFLADDGRLDGVAPGDVVVLDGEEGRHAASVRRLRLDEAVHVSDGRGRRVVGRVAAVGGRRALEVVADGVVDEPAPVPRLVLVQALLKGDAAEQALTVCTEVGVDAVVAWQAGRSVARWDGKEARGLARWRATVREAAKQSRRARVPAVDGPAALDDVLALVRTAALAVVLEEEAGTALPALDVPARGDVVLVVGPEGGLTDGERAALRDGGAGEAHLGPTVLRGATAGVVAASVVLSRTGRW